MRDLCVQENSCGGFGGGVPETHVLGLCAAGDRCDEGMCAGLFVCVPGSTEDASLVADASVPRDASRIDSSGVDAGDGRAIVRYGCDCHCSVGASPRRGSAAPLALVLATGFVVWAHRRRRPAN